MESAVEADNFNDFTHTHIYIKSFLGSFAICIWVA